MPKMFGFFDEYRTVHMVESEVVSGGGFDGMNGIGETVIFWKDKIGGTMLGRCAKVASSDDIEKARSGFHSILKTRENDELERLLRIKSKMHQLSIIHV